MKRYIRTSPDTFSGKMKLINELLSQGIHEINKQDTIQLFGRADSQLAVELAYLGCKVNSVADLFNVKLPDSRFTRYELDRQKHIEKMY